VFCISVSHVVSAPCPGRARLLGLCAFGLSLAACGADPEARPGIERAAVTGGEVSPAAEDAVVRLLAHQSNGLSTTCTGTLVAPNLVLTALHCVALNTNIGFGGYTCRSDGSLMPPDNGRGWLGAPITPSDIHVFFGGNIRVAVSPNASGPIGDGSDLVGDARGQRVFGSGSTVMCVDDIALVELDRPLPSPGLPLRLERAVAVGELMTVIGYGTTEYPVDTDRYRREGIEVHAVGPDDTSQGLGVVAPRAFLTGMGPCEWDEGGPALSDETGAVAGVYSRPLVGGGCYATDQLNHFAKVAPYASLIRQAFAAVGAEPLEEPTGDPGAASSEGCAVRAPRGGQASGLVFVVLALLAGSVRRRGRLGFALAVLPALASLPLACGGEGDDSTKSGGSAGTSAGGTSGSGSGAGGDPRIRGDAGEVDGDQALRAELCNVVCFKPGVVVSEDPLERQSCGNEAACEEALCSTEGFDASCRETLNELLGCLAAADVSLFYCAEGYGVAIDMAAYYDCPALLFAYFDCP
jgi:hypothetical protein